MKTKTIYHLNYDCDKVVRIEVIQKSRKKKKRPVDNPERSDNSISLSPEKICTIYNDVAKILGWRFVDTSHKVFNS